MDIHEYLAEKGVSSEDTNGEPFLFHNPCHTPTKLTDPIALASTLMGGKAILTDRCCGEAGDLRPLPDLILLPRFVTKNRQLSEPK